MKLRTLALIGVGAALLAVNAAIKRYGVWDIGVAAFIVLSVLGLLTLVVRAYND